MSGDWACAEGAIAAGCRFFAGYPITPATEIAERLALRLPQVGGTYMQFEDEIASITAIIGASYSGTKAMTATSGPGLSLMLEGVGLAIMTEAPCVVVDVMRAGPSTGQPTHSSQGDVFQCRWGSHGDYEIIALAPSSVQDMFDMTIEAFNLSERYRVPVFVMADAVVGHLREKLVIPTVDQIKVEDRLKPKVPKENYTPFAVDEGLVPPMASFGEGYRFFATGSTHDTRGYPSNSDEVHEALVSRLCKKIASNVEDISKPGLFFTEDADVLIVAYGSVARTSLQAVEDGRRKGLRIGMLRLRAIWPFPVDAVADAASGCKKIIVPEMNNGKIVREVERAVGRGRVRFVGQLRSRLPRPENILEEAEAS